MSDDAFYLDVVTGKVEPMTPDVKLGLPLSPMFPPVASMTWERKQLGGWTRPELSSYATVDITDGGFAWRPNGPLQVIEVAAGEEVSAAEELTPAQARELAAALILAADYVEANQ